MKNVTKWAAIALASMAMTTTGCSNGDEPILIIDPVEVRPSLTRTEQQMVENSNAFAFNLMRQMQSEKSMVLSPLSITFALGMLNNGAAGETQQQINKVLGFDGQSAEDINVYCYKLLATASRADPLTTVLIANTIYLNERYQLSADFVEKAREFYNAEPEVRNFADGQTMDVINRWAADHTQQMIPAVLDASSFNPYSVSYLLNAIYFKGTWKQKFDKEFTLQQTFYQAGDAQKNKKLPLMHQIAKLNYAESDDYQAVQLPYGNGAYCMTVLLPKLKDGDKPHMLPRVPTSTVFAQLCEQMHEMEVHLELPRFETDTDESLNTVMSQLGMPLAFTDDAEFPNFADKPTKIGLMKQTAKIKVDEEGTEAAAVTAIGVVNSVGLVDYVKFLATHPFLYVISEQKSGAIYFIGQFTGN